MLNLSFLQASHLLIFAKEVCGIDVSSCAKIVTYYKSQILNNEKSGADLIVLWQKAFDLFVAANKSPAEAQINIIQFFNEDAKKLAESPISINLEMSYVDLSVEVQAVLKTISQFLIRFVYENLGGTGISDEEEDDQMRAQTLVAMGTPKALHMKDELAIGVRAALNSVCIPLRRAFVVVANHLKRMTSDVKGSVIGRKNQPALLSLSCNNLQVLATPSLPTSFLNFTMRKYITVCAIKEFEHRVTKKGTKRMCYELSKAIPEGFGMWDAPGEWDAAKLGDVEESEALDEVASVGSSSSFSSGDLAANFKLTGYFDNFASVIVFDPKTLENHTDRGNGVVEMGLMKSYHTNRDHDNTESSLQTNNAELQQERDELGKETTPFQLCLTVEKMHTEAGLMMMIEEGILCLGEFLKFGGSASGNVNHNDGMMKDLDDKLFRVIAVVLRAVEKHTSRETFRLHVAVSTRVSSTSDNKLLMNIEGNSDDRHDAPVKIKWETSFVDIVNDIKSVLAEFRDGGEDGSDPFEKNSSVGGSPPSSGKKLRRPSLKNLSKMFSSISSAASP